MVSEYILIMLIAVAGMLIFGLLVVKGKSLVYSSIYLAITALFAAGVMVLLGYTLVAIFQVAVYVGAAVLFIIISVTLLGEPVKPEARQFKTAIVTGVIGATALVPLIYRIISGVQFASSNKKILSSVLSLIHTKYYIVVIIAFLAFAALLIEGITLAKKDSSEYR